MVDTLHPPLSVIASFPIPNYVNPETHGPGLVVLSILLPLIGILVVATRFYSRIFLTKALGVDDFLILGALIAGIILSALVIIGNKIYYNGHHVWDIPISSGTGHRLNIWIAELFYTLALSCVRISVLLFYRRLSCSFTKAFMIATWVGIIYNVLSLVGFVMTLLLICQPVQAYWLSFDQKWKATHTYHCGSEQIAQPLSAMISVTGDIYSALLPVILISRISLPRQQKRALYSLFSFAFMVIIAGIVRGAYLYKVVNVDYDFTWTVWKVWVWSQIEFWTAMYAASAPALKPFFKRYLLNRLTRSQSSLRRQNTVFLVRSDGKGGMGKVEQIYIHSRDACVKDLEDQTIVDRGKDMAISTEDCISEEMEVEVSQLRQDEQSGHQDDMKRCASPGRALPHVAMMTKGYDQ